jgi:hypothetical protein
MRRISNEELPAHSDDDIRGSGTFAVERDGQVLGYFLPVKPKDVERVREHLEALHRSIDAALQNGYTRDQLTEDLDLSKPSRALH